MTHDEESPWYHYTLICDEYPPTDDCPRRMAYGISVFASLDGAPSRPDASSAIRTVRDISPHREAVADLVRRCNEGGLSPIHLSDVIDDFLNV